MNQKQKEKLAEWETRLRDGQADYDGQHVDFDRMHKLFYGNYDTSEPIFGDDDKENNKIRVLRNIIKENLETEISSAIPAPKVTAVREEDEPKAKIIEDMLRDMIDHMDAEIINDMAERMVLTYGAVGWMCEWDNTKSDHLTVGDTVLSVLHPKQIVPQPGVIRSVDDMDWCIVKIPMTRSAVKKRFGKELEGRETEPDLRSGTSGAGTASDMLTVYYGYYRNDSGGIGLFIWCLDTVLADYDDCQARRSRKCAKCGAPENPDVQPLDEQTTDGTPPDAEGGERTPGVCPYCGSDKWEESGDDYMELTIPPQRSDGKPVFDAMQESMETGMLSDTGEPIFTVRMKPVKIPYYNPKRYPISVQRNVSEYGRLIGESDAKTIETQQNAINRLATKIIQKGVATESFRTRPADVSIDNSNTEGKIYVVENLADLQKFQKFDMALDISQELALEQHYYETSREILGITDSFQGRNDTTAKSGKAKQFSAAQAAGRMEPKRQNKASAYAWIYEMLFKLRLAYADEPRYVRMRGDDGSLMYKKFNRWDFLEKDDAGEYYWNDMFLFSAETAVPLAQNREAMWEETRANFASGAFGDPTDIETMILYWQKMEKLHYPDAAETKRMLEDRRDRQEQAQRAAMEAQARQAAQQQAETAMREDASADLSRRDAAAMEQMKIIERAQNDARADAQRAEAAAASAPDSMIPT